MYLFGELFWVQVVDYQLIVVVLCFVFGIEVGNYWEVMDFWEGEMVVQWMCVGCQCLYYLVDFGDVDVVVDQDQFWYQVFGM